MSNQSMYNLDGWAQITCQASEVVMGGVEMMSVYSTATDPDGVYGPPLIYTEWGMKNGDEPILRHYRWPDSDRECEHWVNTKANRQKWKGVTDEC